TCRQWHAAASRPGLQVHCFMNAYPAYYRHQLQQTLDPVLAEQVLSLWDPPPQPEAGTALERRPVSQLFHELTRRMLAAEHIRAADSNLTLLCASEYNTMYSPDGRYLVTGLRLSHTGQVPCLSIWRREAHSLHQAGLCRLDHPLVDHQMTFSADSRRLLVVSEEGNLQVWQLQAEGGWQLSLTKRLSLRPVLAAKFSPDAHWLALKTDTRLLLFGDTRSHAWQEYCELRWMHAQPPLLPASVPPHAMEFSADSQHLLFVNNGDASVFERCNTDWQTHNIRPDALPNLSFYKAGQLSPRAHWLALVLRCQADLPQLPHNCDTLELWQRHTDRPHWRFSSKMSLTITGLFCPMAFSPDERQLALPERMDNGNPYIAVLSLTPDGNWRSAFALQLGPGFSTRASFRDIYSIGFSVPGRYLAATGSVGVQLWQYQAGAWTPAAWRENRSPDVDATPSFAFSPDGWHCALSGGDGSSLSLHGPVPGGGYQTKMQVPQGENLRRMLFSPDGTCLLLLGGYDTVSAYLGHASLLHLMPAADTEPCARAAASLAVTEADA
ncbi:MAG: WD40 repeat domain-containing protein, partial [Kistimonas sp.]|nr:WD40 repeat domain-containing protein [Kistimonas sp.]